MNEYNESDTHNNQTRSACKEIRLNKANQLKRTKVIGTKKSGAMQSDIVGL